MEKKIFGRMKSHSEPGPGDAGKTGSWRVLRPVIDLKKCIPAKSSMNENWDLYMKILAKKW